MKDSNCRVEDKKGPGSLPSSRGNHHKQWLLAHVAKNGVYLHTLDDGHHIHDDLHNHDDLLAYDLCHRLCRLCRRLYDHLCRLCHLYALL
jgi:hypothetical protein